MGEVTLSEMQGQAMRQLLSRVSSSDQPRLESYSNYNLAVLTPVIFPLTFALVAVLIAGYSLAFRMGKAHPTPRLITAAIVAGEGVFAFFCWGSCVANYAQMGYSGGLSACEFQGWYSGFYSFCQPLLLGGAALCSTTLRKNQNFPSIQTTSALIGLTVIFAGITASLPLMNETHYRFPKDFCLFEIQADSVGGIFFSVFVLVSAVMIQAAWQLCDTTLRVYYPLFTAFFWWGFVTMAAIVLMSWADKLQDHDTVWGWMAILMHTQQLGNPLIYTFLWLPKILEIEQLEMSPTEEIRGTRDGCSLTRDCDQGASASLESDQDVKCYKTMTTKD